MIRVRQRLNEFAKDMLNYTRNTLEMKSMFVLFDSWYSSKSLLKRIKDYSWYFVCIIKRNRCVNGKSIIHIFSKFFLDD
jgi:hypothetical protein